MLKLILTHKEISITVSRQYDDNALLAMDKASQRASLGYDPLKRAKSLRKIGKIGGAVLGLSGIYMILNSPNESSPKVQKEVGAGLIGVGAIWTGAFFFAAHQQKKKAERFQSSTILQYNINLSNGSSLSAGIDMIKDHSVGDNTLGLGLCYNF